MGFNSILIVVKSMMVNPFCCLILLCFAYHRQSVNRFLDSDFCRLSFLQTVYVSMILECRESYC